VDVLSVQGLELRSAGQRSQRRPGPRAAIRPARLTRPALRGRCSSSVGHGAQAPTDALWEDGFASLQRYVARVGHGRVP
jgi:hypothetical protein